MEPRQARLPGFFQCHKWGPQLIAAKRLTLFLTTPQPSMFNHRVSLLTSISALESS